MAPEPGITTQTIRDKARKELLDLLENVRGKKNLVLERALAGTIGHFVKFSTLQQYGVVKPYFLENKNIDDSQKSIIFLARSDNPETALTILEETKRLKQASSEELDISVILVPRRTLVAEKIWEDAGILGDIVLEEFPMYFVPLEPDLLSLELHDSVRDLYLNQDPACLYMAAKALMLLQKEHGLFPRILGKGTHAHRLMELLLQMQAEEQTEEEENANRVGSIPSPTIESLIIIDREVDMATPLLTQLTYEGLLDELFGMQDNLIEASTKIVGALNPDSGKTGTTETAAASPMTRKVLLDSSDPLYDRLRDANFTTIGGKLNAVAKRLQTEADSRNMSNMSRVELSDFVKKLPLFQAEQASLKVHTGLAEELSKQTRTDTFSKIIYIQQLLAAGSDPAPLHEAIEELIAHDTPLTLVLRLLCLESCIFGGLKPKDYDTFRILILQGYGHQHLVTLNSLEKMGLFIQRASGLSLNITGPKSQQSSATTTNYNALHKSLSLIIDDVNEIEPTDIAYAYSGWAPLSVRLVQCITQKAYLKRLANPGSATTDNEIGNAAYGWQGFEDALKSIQGPSFNKIQKGDEAATKARAILGGTNKKKTVIVMFVGGITRAEIAALRFLATGETAKDILICTTSIISGNRLVDIAVEKKSFGN